MLSVLFAVKKLWQQLKFIVMNILGHETYEQWIADGQPTNLDRIVEWRGGEYMLYKTGGSICLINQSIDLGSIFNFTRDEAYDQCGDSNIIKYSHNNKPKRF